MRALIAAERSIAGGLATPSLAEERGRWRADYAETKVDCYLVQHGWKPKEIAAAFYRVPNGRTPGSIEDRVRRARETGKPPLIWPFPNEESDKRARQVREALARLKSSASR